MASVYIETTIVGHLAGRRHPDPVVAARQLMTRKWWETDAQRYDVFVSQFVIDECAAGDPTAAAERLREIETIELLDISAEVRELAEALALGKAIPVSEPRDAFHIAIAAVHGIQYLLTWNFRHIANVSLRGRIEQICRNAGFEPPIICTPDELLGIDDGSKFDN